MRIELLGDFAGLDKFRSDLSSQFAMTAGLAEFQRTIAKLVMPQQKLAKLAFPRPEVYDQIRALALKNALGPAQFELPLAKFARETRAAMVPHFEQMEEVRAFAERLRQIVQVEFDVDDWQPADPETTDTSPGWAKPRPLKPAEVAGLAALVLSLAQAVTWVRTAELRDALLDTSIALLVVLVIFLAFDNGEE